MRYHVFPRSVVAPIACGLLAVLLESAALAQHGDVWMSTDVSHNKIATGIVNEAGTEYTPGIHSLQVILTPDTLPFSAFDYSAEDPGFRSVAGELPASQSVGLALQSLSVWNGSGLEAAAGVTFDFDLSGGFGTEPDGSMHEHLLYGLARASIPDGIYVAAFRLSTAGLADSDLFRFVMLKEELIVDESDAETLEGLLEDYENSGDPPIFGGKDFTFFEDAAAYVATIPEPTGLSLAACIALTLAAYRRRG